MWHHVDLIKLDPTLGPLHFIHSADLQNAPTSPCLAAHTVDPVSLAPTLTGTSATATVTVTSPGLRPSFDNATAFELPAKAEVQTLVVNATRGMLKLRWPGMRSMLPTVTVQNFVKLALGNAGDNAIMRHDATAEDMKFRLEQISGIGRLAVTRTHDYSLSKLRKYIYVLSDLS